VHNLYALLPIAQIFCLAIHETFPDSPGFGVRELSSLGKSSCKLQN
jgi:hypothetical protein